MFTFVDKLGLQFFLPWVVLGAVGMMGHIKELVFFLISCPLPLEDTTHHDSTSLADWGISFGSIHQKKQL